MSPISTSLPVVALLALAGCAPERSEATATSVRGVILISIDTLRADRLGAYGYERPTSPALDALAARGTVFEHAVAESNWTLPSHVSMLSGLPPSAHGVVRPHLGIADGTPLVAEVARDAGVRTFGDTGGGFVGRRYGFARGFEEFRDERDGLATKLARARAFLTGLAEDERFLVFVHTFDVHCPYEPPAQLARAFASDDAEFVETAGRCGNPHFNSMELSDGQVRHLSDLYDAGIRAVDDELGRFVAWLDARDALDDTLLVITSDHGEEFGEHGRIGHERSLHRELLSIPLLLVGPGVAPARSDALVGLADVAPTVLDALGIVPRDRGARAGRSLVPGCRTGDWSAFDAPRRSSLSWAVELRSLTTRTHHLIWDAERAVAELYEADDRREATDVAARSPEVVAELRSRLGDGPGGEAPLLPDLTDDERDELRALGYFE